jgi:hypothetical protein
MKMGFFVMKVDLKTTHHATASSLGSLLPRAGC